VADSVLDNIKNLPNVLAKIVEDTNVRVEKLKVDLPLTSFVDDLTPSTRCLYKALSQENAGFILECKKASPSKGLIRDDFDVKAIAKTYDKYAAGISVLTDEKYFQGKYEYLKAVTEVVSCPVLNKDFFIDTYQVHLARYYGADAILLMLSVLNDDEYQALEAVAQRYDLSILTEVSNQEELDRAIALNAKLIGINNRNLRDLSTDIARTFEYAPKIPQDRIVISESGIYTNAQVRELAPAVDGFLVGSSVMAQDDIDLACRRLIFGQHKICGLTKPEHAVVAANAGAVYGGLIFAEKSPRAVNAEQASKIVACRSLNYVGVFVNNEIIEIVKLAEQLDLCAIQLHGNEDQSYVSQLREQLPDKVQIWKAKAVDNDVPALNLTVEHYVLDGKQPGSGQVFRWQSLSTTEQDLSQCLLAGGLNAENIESAIEIMNQQELYGLDINSGVESSPGEKSSAKINDVFALIRHY
jgi:indole-3-glycerol phosphate synthase / phosphoribosylanthranilate isomerase